MTAQITKESTLLPGSQRLFKRPGNDLKKKKVWVFQKLRAKQDRVARV